MRCLMLLAGLGLGGSLFAAPVDGDEAAALALEWFAAKTGLASPVLAGIEGRPAADPALWLARFEPRGFVLVAADDAARPVVGWSDQTPALGETPAFRDWLVGAEQQIRAAREAGLDNSDTRPEWDRILAGALDAGREVIVQPLLSCRWDQGAGWNEFCPADAAGPGGRVWAGCVATSMVQVMKYWNQPAGGEGSHGYQSSYGWLEVNFAAASYDYAAMSDTAPTSGAAELMYHAGVAVNMGYSPEGSGAYVGWGYPSAWTAMREHFRFVEDCDFIERNSMSGAQWRQRMVDEVLASRPVIYRGYGTGGHAFNLDGWRDDDYFHFNWGWGGSFNGWFLLSSLTPGGNNFSEGQGAIVGLEPIDWQRPPQPSEPAHGADGVPCEPALFAWEAALEAESYDFQLDDDPGFLSPLAEISDLAELGCSITDLEHWRDYWWRLRSRGPHGVGPWTAPRPFTTAYWDETPAPPQVTPADGAQGLNPDRVVFVWDFVPGAQEYGLQLSPGEDFAVLAADSSGIDRNVAIVGGLEAGQGYWWRVRCLGPSGWSAWSAARTLQTGFQTGVGEELRAADWRLAPPWPNPFNPATTISFTQPRAARVELSIFDLAGRLVEQLHAGALPAGEHRFVWDAAARPSGLYFVRLEGPGLLQTRRLLLLR
jgi:hypothetical protein